MCTNGWRRKIYNFQTLAPDGDCLHTNIPQLVRLVYTNFAHWLAESELDVEVRLREPDLYLCSTISRVPTFFERVCYNFECF